MAVGFEAAILYFQERETCAVKHAKNVSLLRTSFCDCSGRAKDAEN